MKGKLKGLILGLTRWVSTSPALRDRLDAETRVNTGVCGQYPVSSGI